jgi:hypothetical protein
MILQWKKIVTYPFEVSSPKRHEEKCPLRKECLRQQYYYSFQIHRLYSSATSHRAVN